ncbi:hypothetical protein [Streptomyces longispororuber]|uniref:hypothetical protein n=1 Tax=Streptomyces longispororuber TaxID=68230 RepID=UPI0036F5C22B
MSDSFTTTYAPLVAQIRTAREQRNARAEHLALEVLINAYVRLGRRELGTVHEQNAYIVARHLGHLPEELQSLGVRPQDVPMPPRRRSPSPAPPPADARAGAAAAAAERVAEHLAHLTAPDDEPAERFTVEERPQDGMLHRGRAAPYAVVDRHDGLPVAWYPDPDWAEYTASMASRLRHSS